MTDHSAVLLLGSNVSSRMEMLDRALCQLNSFANLRMAAPVCLSADVSGLGDEYANVTAACTTSLSLQDFCTALAGLERSAGRMPSSKYTGVMPLDIDVVVCDGVIVSPEDYARPYFCRDLNVSEG